MTAKTQLKPPEDKSETQIAENTPIDGDKSCWPDVTTYYHQTEVRAKLNFVMAWEWWGGPVACVDEEDGEMRPHITAQQLEKFLVECCFMTEQGARRHAYPSDCNDGCIYVLWMAGAIEPHNDGGWVWILDSEVDQLFNIHLAEESSKRNSILSIG